MADKVTPTGFDATLTGLGSIVKEALGPLPQVCQEQVLLDLERARMTAEDLRDVAISPFPKGIQFPFAPDPHCPRLTWREIAMNTFTMDNMARQQERQRAMTIDRRAAQVVRVEELIGEARAGAWRAAHSNGDRDDLRRALLRSYNVLETAGFALNDDE